MRRLLLNCFKIVLEYFRHSFSSFIFSINLLICSSLQQVHKSVYKVEVISPIPQRMVTRPQSSAWTIGAGSMNRKGLRSAAGGIWGWPMGQWVNSAPAMQDAGLIPASGRSPGAGNGNPLQYYCLGNPMDREAWWSTVHGVAKELEKTWWLNNSNNGFLMILKLLQSLLKHIVD